MASLEILVIHITHEGEIFAFISVSGEKQSTPLYQQLEPELQLIDAGK